MPEIRARRLLQAIGRRAVAHGDTHALFAAEKARQKVLVDSVTMPDPGASLTDLIQGVLQLVKEAIS